MARIHLILQGKGGIGKSYIAFLLAQYLQSKECQTLLIDADPVNHSFSSTKALGVERYDITDGDDIDQRTYDGLFQKILDSDEKTEIVIDNGSSGYVSMVSYLISNNVIEHLQGLGHQVFIHTILVGGRDLGETIGKFREMATQLPTAEMVIWLNHQVAGLVQREGKSFIETKSYADFKDQIVSVIDLPQRKESLFVKDISALLDANQTFDEGSKNRHFTVWSKNRLQIVKRETWASIDDSGLMVASTKKGANNE